MNGNPTQFMPTPQPGQNAGNMSANPYEFITGPGGQPLKVQKPKLSREALAIRAGIGFGVVLVIFIAGTAIYTKLQPKGVNPGLVSIAQRQQEIVRIATAATQQTTSQDAKNFVATVNASITSDQLQTLGYLAQHKTKVGTTALKADQSAQTDTQLASALTANTYDSAVTANLTEQLQNYEGLLQTTYKNATGPISKKILQNSFNSADLLIKQAKALQAELSS